MLVPKFQTPENPYLELGKQDEHGRKIPHVIEYLWIHLQDVHGSFFKLATFRVSLQQL